MLGISSVVGRRQLTLVALRGRSVAFRETRSSENACRSEVRVVSEPLAAAPHVAAQEVSVPILEGHDAQPGPEAPAPAARLLLARAGELPCGVRERVPAT